MDISSQSALFSYFYSIIAVATIVCAYYFAKNTSQKKSIVMWMLAGIFFNAFSFSFIYTAYPIAWLPGGHQLFYIAVLHISLSLLAGLPFGLLGSVHYHLRKKFPYLLPLGIGVAAVISDICRSLLLSWFFAAPGKSDIGLHWATVTFGHALSGTPFIEYAYLGGAYVLTGIFCMLIIAALSRTLAVRAAYIIITVIGTYSISYLAPIHSVQKNVTVGIVGLSSSSVAEDNTFASTTAFITEELEQAAHTNILITPEDTRFLAHLSPSQKKTLASSSVTTVIDGDSIIYHGSPANMSYVYDVQSETLEGRGKGFMFPFSEYLPSIASTLAKKVVDQSSLLEYTKNRTYSLGKDPVVFETPYGRVGTLICSEVISYTMIEKLLAQHPDIIIVQTHLPVFHKNPWFIALYTSTLQVLAAQARTTVVVSAYDAPSMVINGHGEVQYTYPLANTFSQIVLPLSQSK